MSMAELLIMLLCLPLIAVDVVFLVEVVLGLPASNEREGTALPATIALLVPAHNEEAGVRATVAALLAASPHARLLVVAHNCADRTADEARDGGAEVAVLDRPDLRGKGYALAHGRARLASDPPEVVVLIDADCVAEDGAIERLAATARASGRAVQASYLFRSRPGDPPVVQISNFALLVKNLVRQRGARRIGAPALMTGSGMAFPWATFARLDLATGNIVEDLAIGLELVRAGEPPLFGSAATIWSTPSSERGTRTQRARWEGGFVATARRAALPLISEGARRGRANMVWMGLHLLTPPLTLLLIANSGAAAVLGGVAVTGGPVWAFAVVVGSSGLTLAAVLAAWVAVGRSVLCAGALVRLPLYFVWKLGLYAGLARRDSTPAWVRTERID